MSAKYKVPRVDIYSTLGLHMTTPIARRRTVADKMDQMILPVTNSPQKNHGDKMDRMIFPVIARRMSGTNEMDQMMLPVTKQNHLGRTRWIK
jgi:hypothetical protein